MNRDQRIEVGDEVAVVLCDANHLHGVVLGLPQATGDSWRIEARYPGRDRTHIYYVQTFWHIRLTKKAPSDTPF